MPARVPSIWRTNPFTPAGVMHAVNVDPDADLTYVVIYASPGPEQQLKQKGVHAFDEK